MYNQKIVEKLQEFIRVNEEKVPSFPEAWQMAQDMLGLCIAANEFSIHTFSYGRWQASFGIWNDGQKGYYRTSRIANDPADAIFLAARDTLYVLMDL